MRKNVKNKIKLNCKEPFNPLRIRMKIDYYDKVNSISKLPQRLTMLS